MDAKEPTHLVELIAGYEERVSALFGVPRSFFAQFTASKATQNPDAREMWRNSQRSLKQLILPILRIIYQAIYGEKMNWDAAFAATDTASLPATRTAMDINISLPGIPPELTLERWWMQGLLKYDAYCGYLSSMYGIPLEHFHPTQQLSLEILNDIKPDTPEKT